MSKAKKWNISCDLNDVFAEELREPEGEAKA